jgi:hypothetical protein
MQLRTAALLCNLFVSAGVIAAQPKIDSLTHRYDNTRSGVNLQETILKKSNVNTKSFGKLTFRNVDGNIYGTTFGGCAGSDSKPGESRKCGDRRNGT